MKTASEAQVRFLQAWQRSHADELKKIREEHSVAHIPLADLEAEIASTIIATMVTNYGTPHKDGEDFKEHDENPEDHERKKHENPHEDGTDGHGDADGDGNGEGSGEGGEGEGQGEGDGDGEGNGDGKEKELENPYRKGSKQQIIAQALIDNDLDAQKAYEQIKDQIGQKPLEFKQNQDGTRVPLPLGYDHDTSSSKTQKGRTKKTINDVRQALIDQKPQEGEGGGNGNGGGSDQQPMYEAEMLLQQLRAARDICERLSADGEPFDSIGMRPYVFGPKMLGAGFPRKAILDSMTMSYPVEVRREINDGKNMPEYDHRKYPREKKIPPMPIEKIDEHLAPLIEKTQGKSLYLESMISLAQAGVPILQIGEKGTGKTTNAEHLAEALAEIRGREMPFGFASMTSGTSPGEFKGRITLRDFLPSLFEKIFSGGGVFLFDELDAGDPNLLTLLNSVLANGYFVNQKGQRIDQSDDFVPVAAMNTQGLGATSRYTGRNRLDAATLDRWAMGRIRVDFDDSLAEMLFWSQVKQYELAALEV